jgi:hypothetical protein
MATKMKMVMKGKKSVPDFAADGKGKMKMGGVKKKLTKAQDGIMTTPENKYNSSGEATQNNGPMTPLKITPGDVSKTVGSTKNFKKGGIIKKHKDGGKTGAQLKKEGEMLKAKGLAMKAKGLAMKVEGNKSSFKKLADKFMGLNPGEEASTPYPFKKGGAIKLKKAMYGSSMMKKGGTSKKK